MNEAGRAIKARYPIATDGATTQQGGAVVAASTGSFLDGRNIARVGDEVHYPDGRKAWIVSGSWYVELCGKPIAVVGSRLNNGDFITISPQNHSELIEFEGAEPLLAEYPVPA